MSKLIETPDILPNNMKQIRLMRGKTTTDIAETLSLNHSYISVVENWKSNISSTTAFKLMNYLNVNFEQFFNMKQTMLLPYTINTHDSITLSMKLNKKYLATDKPNNLIYIEEIMGKELKKKRIEGIIESFKIIDTETIDENNKNVKFDISLLKQKETKKEFDINLLSDMNYELFVKLNKIGFSRKKMEKDSNIEETYEAMSNVSIIQEYLKLDPVDIQEALGITEKTYTNIVSETQKLSLKVMWRMVMLFKVPLELIINVPLYMNIYG